MNEKKNQTNQNNKKSQGNSFSKNPFRSSTNHFANLGSQLQGNQNSSFFAKKNPSQGLNIPNNRMRNGTKPTDHAQQPKQAEEGQSQAKSRKSILPSKKDMLSKLFSPREEGESKEQNPLLSKAKSVALKGIVRILPVLPFLVVPIVIIVLIAGLFSVLPTWITSMFGIFETTNHNLGSSGERMYLSFENKEDEDKYYKKLEDTKKKYPGVDIDLITASLFVQNYAPDFIADEKNSDLFEDPIEEENEGETTEEEEEEAPFDIKKTIEKVETLAKWQKEDNYNYIGRVTNTNSTTTPSAESTGMEGNKIVDPIEWLLSKIPNSVITRGPNEGDHAYDIGVIGDAPGADIPSTVAGTVIRSGGNEAGYSESYGHFVAILDSNGVEHRFAHMIAGSVTVKNGDTVGVGQILGKMGSTGNSTGTHLHYEVDKDNSAIDPKEYFLSGKIVFLNPNDGETTTGNLPDTTTVTTGSNTSYQKVISLEEFKQTTFYQKLISEFIPSYYEEYLPSQEGEERTKKIEETAENIYWFYETYKNTVLTQHSNIGKSCSYQMGNDNISNLKVRLLQCGTNEGTPIEGEGLIDFEDYIAGVVYQEYGGGEIETLKAQAIAARNFALTRASRMGGAGGIKLELENGQWVLSIRSCTNDQAYCSIERGCWSDVAGGESSSTIYQGYDPNKNWSRPPLSQQSEAFQTQFKTALEAVRGQIMLDQNGEIMAVGYSGEFQLEFNRLAQQGYSYEEILKNRYGNPNVTGYREEDKLFTTLTSNCSTAVVDDGEIWSQQDPRWGSMLIGDKTIHDVGCAVTSVAMALRRTGAPLKIPDFNPGTFVTKMKEIGGFDGNSIYWSKAVDSRISDELEYRECRHNYGTDPANSFANLMNEGWAIVTEVNWNGGYHFVFIDRVENGTVYMLDSSAMAWGDTGPVAINSRYTMTGFNVCYRRK